MREITITNEAYQDMVAENLSARGTQQEVVLCSFAECQVEHI